MRNWVEKLEIEFCLISSLVSPSLPPVAALGLFTVNELNITLAVGGDKFSTWKLTWLLDRVDKFPAGTFAVAPPPVKYLTVSSPVGGIP